MKAKGQNYPRKQGDKKLRPRKNEGSILRGGNRGGNFWRRYLGQKAACYAQSNLLNHDTVPLRIATVSMPLDLPIPSNG
jgi:hypothetical protein